MTRVAIVTDSTAYIPADMVAKYRLTVAPQVLIWGKETFRDGVDISPREYYERLSKATVMPSTSQVTIGAFKEIFTQLLDEDCQILAVLVSSRLSGTIDSAIQARAMLPVGAPVEIVDSLSTAMAMGFQVLSVARAIEQGANLAEAKALAEEATKYTGAVFAVDTLEFLHRGGRIGSATRFLGTALNLKPILELRDGLVEPIERVRTRKKSLNRLVELLEERTKGRRPLRLATLHANCLEDAQELLAETTQHLDVQERILSEVSPVIGTHGGPGLIGLAFMAGM